MSSDQNNQSLEFAYHVHYVIYTADTKEGMHRAEILELPVPIESKDALHLATLSLRKAYERNLTDTEILRLYILDWHRLEPEREPGKKSSAKKAKLTIVSPH